MSDNYTKCNQSVQFNLHIPVAFEAYDLCSS